MGWFQDLVPALICAAVGSILYGLASENKALRIKVSVMQECCKDMANIYRELAGVIDWNGQVTEKILRSMVTAVTDLTNIIIEQDTEEDDK